MSSVVAKKAAIAVREGKATAGKRSREGGREIGIDMQQPHQPTYELYFLTFIAYIYIYIYIHSVTFLLGLPWLG